MQLSFSVYNSTHFRVVKQDVFLPPDKNISWTILGLRIIARNEQFWKGDFSDERGPSSPFDHILVAACVGILR